MDELGEVYGITQLPNGREIEVLDCGQTDYETNAFESISGYPKFFWKDTGEDLYEHELNTEVEDRNGSIISVHEFVMSHIDWQN